MNWVVSRLLVLCSAWVAACTVYNQDLLEADGDGGGGNVGGSGATNGVGAAGGTSPGGKGNTTGGTSSAGSSGNSGGSDGNGGSDSPGGGGSGASGADTGSGGTSAGGTSGGSGGSGPPKNYSYELLDDFEDDNAAGEVTDDRAPMWYLFDDESGGVLLPEKIKGVPLPEEDQDARPGSAQALFVSVSGFTAWGAGVGIDFVNPKAAYDASAYAGIRFFAKATSEDKTLRFNVSQVATDSSQTQCEVCDDHYGRTITLTDEWKEYRLLFSELKREGWGKPAVALDLKELLGLMFLVKNGKSVDFWLDDISLMKEVPPPSEENP